MEFKETKIKPESTKDMLRQQVETQSEYCDFTVIHGLWSRRFHSSVLVASPFFQCLFEHNSQEKVKGSAEMHIGTQTTLDASIMFLYGKCPKIDMGNVAYFLEIAEFLLIPNLKSLCVKWLKTKRVAKDNFLELLRMSSMYDFEITSCNKYIKQHLEDILNGEQAISFTKDTLSYLFSDRTLAHVSMETKFKFLIRWTKQYLHVDKRQCYFDELLTLIDIQKVCQTTLRNAKSDDDLKCTFIDQLAEIENAQRKEPRHIVLVAKAPSSDTSLWIFDTFRESWYMHEMTGTHDENCMYCDIDVSSGTESSVIYRIRENYNSSSIYVQDLDNDTVTKTNLSIISEKYEHLAIKSETCFAVIEESVKKNIGQEVKDDEDDISQVLTESTLQNSLSRGSLTVSVLHKGHINKNGQETSMIPILSVPSESGIKLCVNKTNVVAMFLSSKESVLLYDVKECTMEKVFVRRGYNCTIGATSTGFLLLNDKRIVYILRNLGPSLVEKYKTRQLEFDAKENKNREIKRFIYFSDGNRLIRYGARFAIAQQINDTYWNMPCTTT